MAPRTVVLNIKGVNALMRSPAVQAELERRARAIARAAGPGFVVASRGHPWVARAWVQSATYQARVAEATRRALSAAIDAGR